MSVWHGDMRKKKLSGSRKTAYRKKRKYEQGTFPVETLMGERKQRLSRRRGGNIKIKILSEKRASVTDPKTGKTESAEVLRIVKSPANVDYDRRGVITKGTLIETSLGQARVTSRPGQHGILNALLIDQEKS